MTNFKLVLGTVALLSTSITLAQAETSNSGVLALIEADDTAKFDQQLKSFESKANALNCTLLREGPVVAEDGDIDLDQPNRFIYMDCATPILSGTHGRNLIAELKKGSEYAVAMEGAPFLSDKSSFAKAAGERSYILKVSHYNNETPNQRDADLSLLGESVQPRADAYKTEAFVGVTQAYGIPTPDEAVVIYYDTAKAGERFRENNSDVLKKVGEFNNKHLDDFIYYVAQSRR